MDMWGNKLLNAVTTAAEGLAMGFGLKKSAFTDLMNKGPHLLAPTGTDYEKYGNVEEVFATFHQDLNFLTIHGKSRYPGLYIWLRDGTKVPVKMPEGCLLIQAGMQMEHLTAGHVTAGYHEVIATKEAIRRARVAKLDGRIPWRVSSTLFAHVNSDKTLNPLGNFSKAKDASKYPKIKAGAQVAEVLKEIALSNKK
jgi:isopenicillin N synthase-like dioxygenase